MLLMAYVIISTIYFCERPARFLERILRRPEDTASTANVSVILNHPKCSVGVGVGVGNVCGESFNVLSFGVLKCLHNLLKSGEN